MRRILVCATAVLATACGASTTTVRCGGCPGSSVALTGLPHLTGPATFWACVADAPCQTTLMKDPRVLPGLQYVALPSNRPWSSYDGTSARVSVRTEGGRWQGTGTFEYTPPDGSPCDCARLVAPTSLTEAPT